jgi:hypothetical protein
MNDHAELMELCIAFLDDAKNKTPGKAMELWLNEEYGPASNFYERLSAAVIADLHDYWSTPPGTAADGHLDRGIQEPAEATHYFSVTAGYLDGVAATSRAYHVHPYGEINFVVPLVRGAVLAGPLGWRGAGWTSPGPGSSHYSASRGPVMTLTFLPAGRISYDEPPPGSAAAEPGHEQAGPVASFPDAEQPWPFGLDSLPQMKRRS